MYPRISRRGGHRRLLPLFLTIAALFGLSIVVVSAVPSVAFAQDRVPQFVVFVRWQDILAIAGATGLMALLAAYIPIRRLTSIDPVSVFKG